MADNVRFGMGAIISLSGGGFGCDISLGCEAEPDDEWKCPYAKNYIMPMKRGDRCIYREKYGMGCPLIPAQIDALERVRDLVEARISELEEENED